MDTDKVIQDLNRRFVAPPLPEFYQRRIIFWYDEDKEFEAGFSAVIITRLKRGGYISLESVESICRVLNCGVDDILEFIPEDNGGKENG